VAGGGGIDKCEKNAGNDLQAENDGGGAAKYIPPTGGAGGDFMYGCFDGRSAKAEPPLEPVIKFDAALF
jgi:hypothetical protein